MMRGFSTPAAALAAAVLSAVAAVCILAAAAGVNAPAGERATGSAGGSALPDADARAGERDGGEAGAVAAAAPAFEYAVIGPLHEIAEEDLLEVIEHAAAKIDRRRIVGAARARARALLERPRRVAGIAAARRDSVRTFDPSVRIAHDITDAAGNVLFPAGASANPLDYDPGWDVALLLFDGDDPAQVAYAAEVGAQRPVKPVLVGGPWLRLARAWPGPLFFDQSGALSARLQIREVPALVERRGNLLRISVRAVGGRDVHAQPGEDRADG